MTFDCSGVGSIPQAGEDAGVAAAFSVFSASGERTAWRAFVIDDPAALLARRIDPTPQRAPQRSPAAARRPPSRADRELLEASEAVMVQPGRRLASCGTIHDFGGANAWCQANADGYRHHRRGGHRG